MALEGNVKLPGVGEVSKKNAAIGAAVVAGIIGFFYIRQRKNAAASAATQGSTAGTTAQFTDPAGNTCTAPDASGYCPGSAQSDEYLAQQQGFYGSAGLDQYGGWGGGYDTLGNPTGGGTGTTTTATTADQWVIQTAAMLPGNPNTFESAAAKIFAGLTVTTAQKDLFLEGVGLNPLPAGITYPQPIKTSDTSGHGGTVTVPNVVGHSSHVAVNDITAAGLVPSLQPPTPPHMDGIIKSTTPAAGTRVNSGSTVTLINVLHKGK